MKTEDLVTLLSTGAEAVDSRLPARRYLLALVAGALIAFVAAAGLFRPNPALRLETSEPMFWVRETYCAALGALGFIAVVRLARPGLRLGLVPIGIAVAVIAMWAIAVVTLLAAPPQDRAQLIFGHTARICPFLIALSAVPSFIAFIWVLRGLAPTRLRLAGAASGFAAGAIGALVYSLHCPEFAAPFLGIWYLLGILIPTIVGAWVGPRLLRW